MTLRQKLSRHIVKIMEGPRGDYCSLCFTEFTVKPISQTFGGVTKDGKVAVVGDCCLDKMQTIYTTGFFIPGEGTAWKRDDAAWFAAHPARTHRLRKAFPGETDELEIKPPTPDHTDIYIVVRQLEPGKRTRFGSAWKIRAGDLPDTEEFAHALFDFLNSPKGVPLTLFTQGDIERLAQNYKTGTPA